MYKTRKIKLLYSAIIFIAVFFSGNISFSQDQNESRLTLPWNEFKKLLNMDENQIVLPIETFEKLIAQTGVTEIPSFTKTEGQVILSRTEFKKLVDQMKPPSGISLEPPFEYLLTKAVYSGQMSENTTKMTARFQVTVLKQQKYLKIPLLPQSVALEDITVNNGQNLVVGENGYHNVILSKPGDYIITANFSIKSSLEKGPHKLDLMIQQTPITLLQLDIPLADIQVEIPQAQQLLTRELNKTTKVSAIIASGNRINIQWRKKIEIEKIPPKQYCEIFHLISIEEDVLKISSELVYQILHAEIDRVEILLPENLNILSVTGDAVGEWNDSVQSNERRLYIPFQYGVKGSTVIHINSEIPVSDEGITNAFYGLQAIGAVRENGYIGVELNTSAEVRVVESQNLEKIAVQKLPPRLYNKSVKPLIHGFKYLKHPVSLVLDIEKHEKIAVPMATVTNASIVTLFTEDGKIVNRLIYQVRNSAKQFIEISLPEEADVWTVLVGNDPVESSINSNGKLLVPLIRSKSIDNKLNTFPVEIIYCLVESRLSSFGKRSAALPAVDMLTSQVMWSVYLPNDYRYFYFKSTLEKEEIIRGLNVFAASRRKFDQDVMSSLGASSPKEMQEDELKQVYKGKDYKSRFRNIPMREEQIADQMDAEMGFSNRLDDLSQQAIPPPSGGGMGVMPIQIEIPTSGQLYRFAKTIIKPDDPLNVEVTFAQNWVIDLLRWLVIILCILILILLRKLLSKLFRWIYQYIKALIESYRAHKESITGVFKSKFVLFVCIGLFIVSMFMSDFFTLLMFFVCWILVVYQIFLWNERRKNKK
ncbi:hypothetical protein JW935_24600 [candidate division KSB1 bacterium]|nr:hypothetical protein [candidate division KSB1 bacterium]